MMQILENLRERISQLKTGNYPTNLTNLPFTRRAYTRDGNVLCAMRALERPDDASTSEECAPSGVQPMTGGLAPTKDPGMRSNSMASAGPGGTGVRVCSAGPNGRRTHPSAAERFSFAR
jgi:hypothetical protein